MEKKITYQPSVMTMFLRYGISVLLVAFVLFKPVDTLVLTLSGESIAMNSNELEDMESEDSQEEDTEETDTESEEEEMFQESYSLDLFDHVWWQDRRQNFDLPRQYASSVGDGVISPPPELL